MTDKQFFYCVQNALECNDRDAYISDVVLSTIWGDEPTDGIPEERIAAVGQIWDAAHRSVREIAAAVGMSHRKLAERFCIPYRTMEDWCRGAASCPVYTRLMMQEALHLLHR